MKKEQYKLVGNIDDIKIGIQESEGLYSLYFSVTNGEIQKKFSIKSTFENMLNLLPKDELPKENNPINDVVIEKWKEMVIDKYLKLINSDPDQFSSDEKWECHERCDDLPYKEENYSRY